MKALVIAAGLLCVLAFTASAQTQTVPSVSDDIVVRGQREIEPKTARRFVQQISSSVDGQMTRFSEPVCPSVFGFEEAYNRIVADRIRAVAAQAGAEVGREGCRSNLNVLIVPDSDGAVRELQAKLPGIFDGVDDAERARALRDGPVHAWNAIELRNEDGQPASGGTLYVKTASIIDRSTQQAIVGSTIVIEQRASLGKTLRQIADYVALRALAGGRPPAPGVAADTILTLFDSNEAAPAGATIVDRAYLKGLYKTRPSATGTSARARIARQIARDTQQAATETP
ncbi:hypothetical protein ACX40Y_08195 [Sphingomonas sp. RS6]